MKNAAKVLQIAFTYIGTIVGAGFATGQEILQFFTLYGKTALFTIILATALFIWLGTKMMLMAGEIGAKSYEDLNRHLFGDKAGNWISLFSLVILFAITSIMLAGAGSLFEEHLNLSYQLGLLLTLALGYLVLSKGIGAIMAVNSIVVPVMIVFTIVIVWTNAQSPNAGVWLELESERSLGRIWTSPFLYVAFNLALAQAVLVPVGASVINRNVVRWGGIIGGLGIGLMLLAGHFALSANMPAVKQFEIPMGMIVQHLGPSVQYMYLLVIFAEIFTTFIADAYGLSLQLHQRTGLSVNGIIIFILIVAFAVSQIGFSTLLSTLYPLFGLISLFWILMMMWKRRTMEPQ
jgi:uncharacterized membrane protein YkvI